MSGDGVQPDKKAQRCGGLVERCCLPFEPNSSGDFLTSLLRLLGTGPLLEGSLAAFEIGMAIMLVVGWWVFISGITPPVMFNCRLTLYVAITQRERAGAGVLQMYRAYQVAAERALGYFFRNRRELPAIDLHRIYCGSSPANGLTAR